MPKPLNLLAMVLPVLGSALVACVDGLPDDSAGASPSESSEVNPAPTESSASAAASPSSSSSAAPAPSSPSPSPSSSPSADAGTADAAQPSADAGADANVDASADATPPAPKYDCTPIDQAQNATARTCSISKTEWLGGTIAAGGYTLTEWSDGTCADTLTTRQGTMYIEQNGGDLYARWIRTTPTSSATGTALLETAQTSVVRTELCSKKAIVLGPATLAYTATSTTITFANGKGYEKWTRIPRTLPGGPIVTDPVIVVGQ